CPLQRLAQDRDGSDKGGITRSARAHPAIGNRRGTAQRIRVPDAHPDRRTRFLHRLWRHRGACKTKDAAGIVDPRLGPQRLDHLNRFAEASDPALARGLGLLVMMVPTEPDAEDGAAIAY